MVFQIPGNNHPLDDYERGPRAAAPSPVTSSARRTIFI